MVYWRWISGWHPGAPGVLQAVGSLGPMLVLAGAFVAGCAVTPSGPPLSTSEMVHYPAAPDEPRIVFLATLDEMATGRQSRDWLRRYLYGPSKGGGSSAVKPFGIQVWHDEVLICDTQQNCVHSVSLTDGQRSRLGEGANSPSKPLDVDVDAMGNRYVADAGRGQVLVYDANNLFVRNLIDDPTESFKPVSVAVGDDTVYVADAGGWNVHAYAIADGAHRWTIGGRGQEPGEFLMPSGVAVDRDRQVYVVDSLLCRVQVFDSTGTFVRQFGQPGQTAGSMARPRRIAVGPDGVIYVADALFNRVHMFDQQGRILMLFGGPGDAPGATNLAADICIDTGPLERYAAWIPTDFDPSYVLLVTSQLGAGRVNIYAFGQMRAGNPSAISP
ncbi:MAG: hypothetical protein IH988_00100 [Planctomycetes bacterium]|nr:hypothetical protein [Planctomycetota bacterium]